MAACPDATIILSVRDSVDQRYTSITGSMQLFTDHLYPEPGFMGWLNSHLAGRPKEDAMVWKLLQHTYYPGTCRLGKQHYLEHNKKIRRLAKEQGREFLEFNVK